MKKIFAVTLMAAIVLFVAVAMAGQAGIINRQGAGGNSGLVQLYSGATGTTATVATSYATFDYPMNNLACEGIVTPATGATATFTVNGNLGGSTTNFPATSYLLSTATISATSLSSNVTMTSTSGKPFRTISGFVTASTTTAVVTVNCAATQ